MSLLLYLGAAWAGAGALLVAYGVGRHRGIEDAKADLRDLRDRQRVDQALAADGGEASE